MEDTPVLHTPRLTLDRFTQADAETVCRDLFSSEAVCRNLLLQPGTPLEEVRDILRRLEEGYAVHEDFFQWAIREQGVCIGRMSLTVNRRHLGGTVAYYLAERAWGKGYMTEVLRRVIDFAFDGLGLNRVEADHFAENPASGRVMEKAGMTKEGYARRKYCKNGVFHDAVLYGILKEDRK